MFSFLKLFFPSWNFFGGSTDTPYLFVKIKDEFVPVFPPEKTKLFNLVFNPHGNLYLAYHSNMQSLLNEIYFNQDNPQFNLLETPIYLLTKNWAENYFYRNKIKVKEYCFKFSYVKMNLDRIEIHEDIFISPTYELL